jgi:hypothetical protein
MAREDLPRSSGSSYAFSPMNVPQSGGYAMGWFTLALINAGLAQAKGRSGLAWWMISLLLGPVATLLVVVLDPVPQR